VGGRGGGEGGGEGEEVLIILVSLTRVVPGVLGRGRGILGWLWELGV
jgi:hypothetical protein